MARSLVSAALQVAGIGAFALGAYIAFPPAGLAVAGLGLFAAGILLGLPPRRRE